MGPGAGVISRWETPRFNILATPSTSAMSARKAVADSHIRFGMPAMNCMMEPAMYESPHAASMPATPPMARAWSTLNAEVSRWNAPTNQSTPQYGSGRIIVATASPGPPVSTATGPTYASPKQKHMAARDSRIIPRGP